jgi:hypothetical protein
MLAPLVAVLVQDERKRTIEGARWYVPRVLERLVLGAETANRESDRRGVRRALASGAVPHGRRASL